MNGKAQRLGRIEAEMQRVLSTLVSREVRDPRVGNVTITTVSVAPDMSTARVYFVPFAMNPHPDAWRVLAQTGHALVLKRDAHTLEVIVPENRALFPAGEADLFRSEDAPLVKGDVVEVPGLRVEILGTGQFGPRHARYTFEANVDDIAWFTDDREAIRGAELPPMGMGAPFDP